MPKVNKPKRPKTCRAKQETHEPKQEQTESKKVDEVIQDKPIPTVQKFEPIQKAANKDLEKVQKPEEGPIEKKVKIKYDKPHEEPIQIKQQVSDSKKKEALDRSHSLYQNHLAQQRRKEALRKKIED